MDHREGVQWVLGRASDLLTSWDRRLVVEQTGTAAFLLPTLERDRLQVEPVPRRFYVDVCAALDAAVAARAVRHGNEAALGDAVAVSRWSTSGDAGSRVLSRRDPRVSPLVAAALALHGLSAAQQRPGRFISF